MPSSRRQIAAATAAVRVRREVRIRRPRSRYEELDRAVSQQLIHIVGAFGRHSER
jgi:hypothetical protein